MQDFKCHLSILLTRLMKFLLGILTTLSLLAIIAQAASPPVVSNVTVSQRAGTKLVDVYYSLSDADGGLQNVQMEISGDGGQSYTITCVTLSGDVGLSVSIGTNKHIVWNAGVDWNGQLISNMKVRVSASDGSYPMPPAGMGLVPAGPFQMGDNLDGDNFAPVHNVILDTFFIDRTEVPRDLWLNVQSWGTTHGYSISAGSSLRNGDPISSVTWYDAVKWCNARSEKEGLTPCYYTDTAQTMVFRTGYTDITSTMVKWNANGYRLPTEAEWEKAARGGLLGQRYPWGNTISGSQANYINSGDPYEGNYPRTTPVGYYNGGQVPAGVDMANGYGLYDMAGNDQEWCWDWFDTSSPSSYTDSTNPHGPLTGNYRILRSGSWAFAESGMRCAMRNNAGPGYSDNSTGLRCVRSF